MRGAELFRETVSRLGLESELPKPGEDGFFRRYGRPILLPWLRVYWGGTREDLPWQQDTWKEAHGGFVRFLRPDHLVDFEIELAKMEKGDTPPPEELGERLRRALVRYWLVPVDEVLERSPDLADALVETVRLGRRGGRFTWTTGSGDRLGVFPDELRAGCEEGLDPVHTPESERAGLRRFLRVGWSVGDDGRLVAGDAGAECGPLTRRIEFRRHDGARRLMLGCSLSAGAVPLANGASAAGIPGLKLRAAAICGGAFAGWVHEDAFVVSRSAAEKLSVLREEEVRALIPVAAPRPTICVGKDGAAVAPGEPVVSATVDLFALGFSRPEVKQMGLDPDTGLQVLQWKASASGTIASVRREPIVSPRWREAITVTLRPSTVSPIRVGDKLSTGHGLKGVVSRIVPDAEMPGGAEILLPYFGVVRRGAFGQLREMGLLELPAAEKPVVATGEILVNRQPHDAEAKWRVRGARTGARGQRYGEWELMALVAHGAEAVLAELLSRRRAAVSWLEREERLWMRSSEAEPSAGQLLRQALNRYLAAAGGEVHVEAEPRLKDGKAEENVFDLELYGRRPDGRETSGPKAALVREALELLEDEDAWEKRGGTARLRLKAGGREITVFLLPPWLRRNVPGHRHPLTLAYARLIHAGTWWKRVEPALRQVGLCLRQEGPGLPGFVRNYLLGRRLTRSARAVIVPRPDLRIDQIAIPRVVADVLFEGLPAEAAQVVLVNRNPTLHRRGLLALRPVIGDDPESPVFGLPLGVLSSLAADFDGDQASVVALETPEARAEALEKLLPGSDGLRKDRFRDAPAFPLLKELSAPERELELARDTGRSQVEWADAHGQLVSDLLASLPSASTRSWMEREIREIDPDSSLWNGLDEEEWLERSAKEVGEVCKGQRRKAAYGGILRRELYLRDASDGAVFGQSIEALQAITERLVQGALKLKGMKLVELPPVKLVERALSGKLDAEFLARVDASLDSEALRKALDGAARLGTGGGDPLKKWLSKRGKAELQPPSAARTTEPAEDAWLSLLLGG